VSKGSTWLSVAGVQGRSVAGRNRLGPHPDPATRTAQALRSTCGLTRIRSVIGSHCWDWTRIVWSAHTIFAKATGVWITVDSARKWQGLRFVQSTRTTVRLCGAAAETSRPLKLNSRIRVTGDPAGHGTSGWQGAAIGARKTKAIEQVNSVPARHGPRARAGRCVLGCVVKGQRRVPSGP
jgi:hypothetical protein